MGTPVLLLVDEDRAVLEALAGDLGRRFGSTSNCLPRDHRRRR
jgi:hypothetical protein